MLGSLVKWMVTEGNKSLAEEKYKSDHDKLCALQQEIVLRIMSGQDVDSIASDYHELHGIDRPRTLLIAASFIDALARDSDPRALELARAIVGLQQLDAVVGPEEFVAQLNSERTVFIADRCRAAFARNDWLLEVGIVVLSTAYIYFFPWDEKQFSYSSARVKGVVENTLTSAIPGLGLMKTVWDVGSGAFEGSQDFFAKHGQQLKKQLRHRGAFAIPLANVHRFGATSGDGIDYLFVDLLKPGADRTQRFLITPRDPNAKEWITVWMEILPLATITEGRLLLSPPSTQGG